MSDLPDDDHENPAPELGWYIDSDASAAYAVDRLLSRAADLARIKAASAACIERAERELSRAEAFFLPQLSHWMLDHPPAKGQTLHYPTGSFSARKTPARWDVVDEAACIAWAREACPEVLTVPVLPPVKIQKADLNRLRSLIGEPPPGVVVVDETTTYAVKAPKEKP